MEAKQHISPGLCIETRTTIKQLHDNAQSHNGIEKKIMVHITCNHGRAIAPGWRYTFCTLTHMSR